MKSISSKNMLAQQKPSLYQLSEIKDGPRMSNVGRDDESNDYYINDDVFEEETPQNKSAPKRQNFRLVDQMSHQEIEEELPSARSSPYTKVET